MKRLKTLALAGIVAISACTTTHQATRGSEQSPSETLHLLEAGTDSMYARMSDDQDLTRTLARKEGIRYTADQDVTDAFTQRYYGLDALSRTNYLIEDLLNANQHIKDLNEHQELSARERSRYEQRIDELTDRVRALRRSLDKKPEVVYETRYVERTPVTRRSVHPVDKDVPFIRLGNSYFQFPFARIICPGPTAPRKACIDVQDVKRDYQQHLRENNAESLRD